LVDIFKPVWKRNVAVSKRPTSRGGLPSKPETNDNPQSSDEESDEATTEGELRNRIERQISPIVSVAQRNQIIERVTRIVSQEFFRGPIAHPRHLEHYERICPGSADRIIAMAEKEQEFRSNLETQAQADETADRKRGMYCGFVAFLSLVAGGSFSAYLGLPWLAAGFIGVGVLSVAGLFVHGRMSATQKSS
jgi:uncharacterized membrane protein